MSFLPPNSHIPQPIHAEPVRPINRLTAEMWKDYRIFKARGCSTSDAGSGRRICLSLIKKVDVPSEAILQYLGAVCRGVRLVFRSIIVMTTTKDTFYAARA